MSDFEHLMKLERQSFIRKLVKTNGRVTVLELSKQFNVSDATIRRDLDELTDQGWIRRTHGGAMNSERVSREQPMVIRAREHQAEKERIGQAAAQLIRENETIFLGSGSTALEIARHLPPDLTLTVITNSLPVVNTLADYETIELIVIGGMLRISEYSMVGHIAEQAIKEIRADRVFIGMHAIDLQHGFTNDFLPEVMTDRAILEIALQVVIVSDSSKFGRISSVLVAPIDVADLLITDHNLPAETVEEIQTLGIDVLLV
jgi:DeoR/GlpR family transcriptional regulator of sugar metabolism